MDWIDYREKLGIGFCDKEKLKYLQVNINNHLETIAEKVSFQDYFNFCNMAGIVCRISLDQDWEAGERFDIIRHIIINSFSTLESFLSCYIAFLNTYKNPIEGASVFNREDYKNLLLNLLRKAHIPYDIIEEDEDYFVFPRGAQEFDDALVSQPLEWLTKYPKAHKTFCTALRQYSDGFYIRDVADNLRKALEEFLREFLGNDCDLNKNKKGIEAYLKTENADPQLINMFGSLITHYYLLNNEIAKHNDKVDSKYLEFLLYQTGIFIRMLIVVKQNNEEANHAH